MKIEFSEKAQKDFIDLPLIVRRRIETFLNKNTKDRNTIFQFSKKLKSSETSRFRVGDYRITFVYQENSILILRIRHRREVYRHPL